MDFQELLDQFEEDDQAGAFSWLPAGKELVVGLEKTYRTAPITTFLRAADALHLACAREYGFREIYSHDRHMLEAAPLFGLRGKNVIK